MAPFSSALLQHDSRHVAQLLMTFEVNGARHIEDPVIGKQCRPTLTVTAIDPMTIAAEEIRNVLPRFEVQLVVHRFAPARIASRGIERVAAGDPRSSSADHPWTIYIGMPAGYSLNR
jgi:hypothetical protein